MADITDPRAIAYVNETIRPLAERLRALKVEIDAATVTWFGGVNALVPNRGEDPVQDGREAQGVSRLSGADVTNAVSALLAVQAALDVEGRAAVVSKPCVRPLRVTAG